jgi:hypothetical protein
MWGNVRLRRDTSVSEVPGSRLSVVGLRTGRRPRAKPLAVGSFGPEEELDIDVGINAARTMDALPIICLAPTGTYEKECQTKP